jgi:phosphatidylinositol 4-kinase
LLPIIAHTFRKSYQTTFSTSREMVILFRNVWFFCTLYNFVDHEAWLPEWHKAIEVMAIFTPALVYSVKNYIESDLELNSVLRQITSQQVSKKKGELKLGFFFNLFIYFSLFIDYSFV